MVKGGKMLTTIKNQERPCIVPIAACQKRPSGTWKTVRKTTEIKLLSCTSHNVIRRHFITLPLSPLHSDQTEIQSSFEQSLSGGVTFPLVTFNLLIF
jgi:hypothetical protein